MARIVGVGLVKTRLRFSDGKKVYLIEVVRTHFWKSSTIEIESELIENVKMPKFFNRKDAEDYVENLIINNFKNDVRI